MAGSADAVSREEFEAVRALAVNARSEVEALRAEIAAMKSAAA
jgi:BMFP domain-containing protein YqiC